MRIIATFIILFYAGTLSAQGLSYKHYTVNDGLPSNETYAVFQDREGYIWIGTDRGVNRFDGYKFETFTTEDGLPDNTIFQFYQDGKGRIWFYSFNGKIGFFLNGKFHQIQLETEQFIRSIFVDSNDRISIEYFNNNDKKWLHFNLVHHQVEKSSVKWDLWEKVSEKESRALEQMDTVSAFLWLEKRSGRKKSFQHGHSLLTAKLDDNSLCLRYKNSIVIVDSNVRIKKTISSYQHLGEIKTLGKTDKYWYVFYASHTLLKFDLTTYELLAREEFGKIDLSSIIKDCFGGIWMSTLNNGVFYIPNDKITVQNLDLANGNALRFNKSKNAITIIPAEGRVYTILNGKKIGTTHQISGTLEQIRRKKDGFMLSNQHHLWDFNSDGQLERDFNKKSIGIKGDPKYRHFGLYDGFISKEGVLISCARDRIYMDTMMIRIDGSYRLVSLLEQGDTLWAGGINGLFAFSKKHKKQLKTPDFALLKNRINQLKSKGQDLLIATRGVGLLILHQGKVYQIKKQDGLISNSINQLESDGEAIWVSSNSGISRIKIISFFPFQFEVLNLDRQDGIFSKEISDFQLFGDSIYILSDNKLFTLNKSYKGITAKPRLVVHGVYSKKSNQSFLKPFSLQYDDNNLILHYTGIYFPNIEKISYHYSLDGGKSWLTTAERSITFLNLSPGNYSILLKAVAGNGKESELKRISFVIHPPFWRTWWFITLCLLLFGVLILFLVRYRMRVFSEKEELKRKFITTELKALRSQLNPHFTFNVLNSIQNYVRKNNADEAIAFISKFARLMRMILDHASEEYVTIQREIDILKTYLEIEALRYGHKFTFSITVEEDIDTQYAKIPSMVIQPFVENAIWHGVMQKEDGMGTIAIRFKSIDETVLCVIEDNGVGREKAQELKKNEAGTPHKSYGISISKDRMSILNKVGKGMESIRVLDLKDEYERPTGTKVEIIFNTYE